MRRLSGRRRCPLRDGVSAVPLRRTASVLREVLRGGRDDLWAARYHHLDTGGRRRLRSVARIPPRVAARRGCCADSTATVRWPAIGQCVGGEARAGPARRSPALDPPARAPPPAAPLRPRAIGHGGAPA